MTVQDSVDAESELLAKLDDAFEERGFGLLPSGELPDLEGPFTMVGFSPAEAPDAPATIAAGVASVDDLEPFDRAVAAIQATHPDLAPTTALSMSTVFEVTNILPGPFAIFTLLSDGEPIGFVARQVERRSSPGGAAEGTDAEAGPEAAADTVPSVTRGGAPVGTGSTADGGLGLLQDVALEVSVELGRSTMPLAKLMNLGVGSIVELDRAAGAPVDVRVNGTLFAHGEVVVVDGEYAVRIIEILDPPRG